MKKLTITGRRDRHPRWPPCHCYPLDNATYHHPKVHKHWRSQAKSRFALEFRSPYSPDLSPIERVWKLTRRKATHNRYLLIVILRSKTLSQP
ncbi:MAG: transposase [Chlorobi bacterium]|nr:transposase [Chlorobiota bacterium]